MATILVIEDENVLARNMCDALTFVGHDASSVRTGEDGLAAVETEPPDLILLDNRLPGMDGLAVLRELRKREVPSAVVMITAHGNVETAVAAMKAGAQDFLIKPLDLKQLEALVNRVLESQRREGELQYFRERERSTSGCDSIIGESQPIADLKRLIQRLVSTPALSSKEPPGILITGETGTGKDVAAHAIHYDGPRKDGPFVHVNCTALPDHLVEAELFGHVKGAFTDARRDKQGLLECADGGTVFLDEIGHMPLTLQAKLLQTLEHRTIRPVGGTKQRRINVHFIAATNRDMETAIEENSFREDLYHRLCTVHFRMAPLRERGNDAILLAEHFLQRYAQRFGMSRLTIGKTARQAILAYDWPGNVRELAHVMESAVLMVDGLTVRREHLNIQPSSSATAGATIAIGDKALIELSFDEDCPSLEEIEYRIINAAIEHAKHNLTRAARTLGISRDAIRYRIERYQQNRDAPET
jgi:DNA-binding NtrC family response regulator